MNEGVIKMRKIRKSIAVWLLLLCVVFSMAIPVRAAENADVEDFVTRFYVHILNRQPDSAGLSAWSENLRSGKEQGVNVGYGFVQSPEFKKRNLNDEEYIKVLYRAFFDREADNGGLNAWKKVLDSGLSRMHVYKGFAESNEFTKVCARYGITRGNIKLTAPMDQNEGVTKFVARCYKLCLGRRADEDGLNAWCSQILSGANSAKQAAHGFVFSDEFKKKNLSDKEYVKVLYRVFMDREADSSGLNAWVKVLNEGRSRTHVFNGFADSNEFKKICDSYGIYAGEPLMNARYENYLSLIAQYEKSYGKCSAIEVWEEVYMMSGLCFAKLIDFDNNGRDEIVLVTGEQNPYGYDKTQGYTMQVWAYENNKLKCLYSGGVLHGGDVASNDVAFTTYNGYPYLVTGMRGAGDDYDFWGYRNGKFEIMQSVRIWDSEYIVNGVRVSRAEAERALKRWTQNAKFYDLTYVDSPYYPKPFDFKGLIAQTKQQLGY